MTEMSHTPTADSIKQKIDAFLQIEPADQIRLLREAADQAERGEDELSLLERACRLSFSDYEAADALLRRAPDSGNYRYLHQAVLALLWTNRPVPASESDIRRMFYGKLAQYLPGAEQIKYSCVRSAIPDGMICWNGREMPVEIKKDAFDLKAIRQLQRYMDVYDCEHGIAVAPKLTCRLPANMTFVEVRVDRARRGSGPAA
ncbi:hypothetical protein [Methylorubrum thiocyanatum]|uniref:hypothetical protein n=1 Tax=Methylorubrum thiocyanatum TaxID=47958 RepID=UPI0035C83919